MGQSAEFMLVVPEETHSEPIQFRASQLCVNHSILWCVKFFLMILVCTNHRINPPTPEWRTNWNAVSFHFSLLHWISRPFATLIAWKDWWSSVQSSCSQMDPMPSNHLPAPCEFLGGHPTQDMLSLFLAETMQIGLCWDFWKDWLVRDRTGDPDHALWSNGEFDSVHVPPILDLGGPWKLQMCACCDGKPLCFPCCRFVILDRGRAGTVEWSVCTTAAGVDAR